MADDTRAYNRKAWDRQVAQGNPWTVPFGRERIEAARRGDLSVVLIGQTPAQDWLPDPIGGSEVLCLASGGGQQGPLLAAAGARITVFDNSPAQLARDREVSDEYDLGIRTVEGDMTVIADEGGAIGVGGVMGGQTTEVRDGTSDSDFREGGGVIVIDLNDPSRGTICGRIDQVDPSGPSIRIDPNYGSAWALLGFTFFSEATSTMTVRPSCGEVASEFARWSTATMVM